MFSGNRRIRTAVGIITVLLLTVPAMTACSEEEVIETRDKELAEAYTGFGIDLMKVLADRYEGENIFISPSSIAYALAMTYNGAATSTEEAMARTLRIDALSRDEINVASRALTDSLTLQAITRSKRQGILPSNSTKPLWLMCHPMPTN